MQDDRSTSPTSEHPAGSGRGRSRVTTAALGAGIGITAVVGLAIGASGLAGAADDTTDPTEQSEATAERGEHLADALAPLVADGTLTQDQADAVVARLHEAWADRPGHGGPRGGVGGEAAAEVLGMTTDELREALRSGTTLAELAEERGVAIDTLVDAMLTGMEERLAERVADGDITQEQADERLAEATERVTDHINGEHEHLGRGERWGA